MSDVEMKNIVKAYDGVPVLKNVSVGFNGGEIHALMGANGAGKSTLMNILAGVTGADGGEIHIFGEKAEIKNISDAEKYGIVMIHQELNLMGDLTAAQNIFIGREPKKGIFIDDNKMNREAEKLFEKMGLDIDLSSPVRSLSIGKRQMVEIAKALSKKSRVLILDEPTAALSTAETNELFKIMRELKQQGICLIYISHRMNEIFSICDRISVLRDGTFIGTSPSSELSRPDLVKMMVGRNVEENIIKEEASFDGVPEVLSVNHLFCAATGVKDVSFTLRKGEVLGFAGLVGAGRTETVRAMTSIDRKDRAKIYVNGSRVHLRSPADAKAKGICYLSEDRRRDGMLLGRSIAENTVISSLKQFIKFGSVNFEKAMKKAEEINKSVSSKYSSLNQPIESLSGGNQQKVILARWLLAKMDIIILDEPTRGIDVGAKEEIYEIIENLTKQGKSVILISSETSELRRLSDRIIVMCEGRITKELKVSEADDETILKYATSGSEEQ